MSDRYCMSLDSVMEWVTVSKPDKAVFVNAIRVNLLYCVLTKNGHELSVTYGYKLACELI